MTIQCLLMILILTQMHWKHYQPKKNMIQSHLPRLLILMAKIKDLMLKKDGKNVKRKRLKKLPDPKNQVVVVEVKEKQPKRAMSAYFLWMNENRNKIKSELPSDAGIGDI